MSNTAERIPAAILTGDDILLEASQALADRDKLQAALRDADTRLRVLCRQYEAASGYRMLTPNHLAHMCRARGLMPC